MFVVYVIALFTFGIDQFVKWVITTHMLIGESIPVFPPALYLAYIRNPGGAFSIFPNQRWLFILVALVVIGAVIVVNRKWKPALVGKIGLGLLLGGALGNLSDRLLHKTVVDYVYLKSINFAIFNAADVAIDVGVILLVLYTFLKDRQTKNVSSKEDVQS
jgi:signal peptidase II